MSSGGYPVAGYRTEGARALGEPGFQRLSEVLSETPDYGSALYESIAATDLRREGPSKPAGPRSPWLADAVTRRLLKQAALSLAPRAAARLIPPLNAVMTLADLWEFQRQWLRDPEAQLGNERYNKVPMGMSICWGTCANARAPALGTGWEVLNGGCGPTYPFPCFQGQGSKANSRAYPEDGGHLEWVFMNYVFTMFGATKGDAVIMCRWPNQATAAPHPSPLAFMPPTVRAGVGPSVDPMLLSLLAPTGTPEPIPHWAVPLRQPNPMRSPVESSSWGYDLRDEDGRSDRPEEARAVEVYPGAGGRGVPVPPEHRYAPPGPRTKEGKTSLRAAGGVWVAFRLARRLINAATESGDVVDAIWDAVPFEDRKHWRHKGKDGKYHDPRLTKKVQLLYEHWDKVDTSKALRNIALNELEDTVIGQSHHYVNKGLIGTGYYRSPVGYGTGPAT